MSCQAERATAMPADCGRSPSPRPSAASDCNAVAMNRTRRLGPGQSMYRQTSGTNIWYRSQVPCIGRLALHQLLHDNSKQRPALLFVMLDAMPAEVRLRMAQVGVLGRLQTTAFDTFGVPTQAGCPSAHPPFVLHHSVHSMLVWLEWRTYARLMPPDSSHEVHLVRSTPRVRTNPTLTCKQHRALCLRTAPYSASAEPPVPATGWMQYHQC